MWANFHTHSHYCDGTMSPEDYLVAAERAGVAYLGFSSHAPLPFQRSWSMKPDAFGHYLSAIEALKPRWPDIEIFKGLEIDFIPDTIGPSYFARNLDYTIGSIHFVDSFHGHPWEIDNTTEVFRQGLSDIFGSNVRAAVTRYFALTRQMVTKDPPDIVGHLDKIKIHNAVDIFFEESENWYRDEVDKTLDAIAGSGSIIEVNTRGLYKKKSNTTYPSPWILERIAGLSIPITLSSDAHRPEELVEGFPFAATLLEDIGFKKISILKGGTWTQVPVQSYGIVR